MHNEVEFFSFFVQCGELSGKRVLDIASGEGRYTRMIKARGAARVVGLDLSDEMVKLADSDESQQRAESHIEYMQHDLAQPLPAPMRGGFDVVTSQYLLCCELRHCLLPPPPPFSPPPPPPRHNHHPCGLAEMAAP